MPKINTVHVTLELDVEIIELCENPIIQEITFKQKRYDWKEPFYAMLERAIADDIRETWRKSDV